MFQPCICQISFLSTLHFMLFLLQTWSWFCCFCLCCQADHYKLLWINRIAWIFHPVWMKYIWPGVTGDVALFEFIFNICILVEMILSTYFLTYPLNSAIRSLITVESLMCVTYDYTKGARSSSVVSLEVVGPELVFVKWDTMRNKYLVGLVKWS